MKLFNLLCLPVAGMIGVSYLVHANSSQPEPQTTTLKPWKVQPVAMPIIDPKFAHQALLARQKQITGNNFSCDCNGCRVAAAQVGVTLN